MKQNRKNNSTDTISRRRIVQGIGAGTAVSLAGCSSSSDTEKTNSETEKNNLDEQNSELGEQVPPIQIAYWTGTTSSAIAEQFASLIKEDLEAINIPVEVKPIEFSRLVEGFIEDQREYDFFIGYHSLSPSRLDPHFFTRRYAIDWAGGDGNGSLNNYASCEYSKPALGQATASSEEERREMVNEAHGVGSEDYALIPLARKVVFSAVRNDEVNLQRTGKAGVIKSNPYTYIHSTPRNGNSFTGYMTPHMLNTENFPSVSDPREMAPWTHLVHSPLVGYNESFELTNNLAEDFSIENDGKLIRVTLRDATFHNGDPITSEDVKFTFTYLTENGAAIPQSPSIPYKEIRTPDEKTTEFVFDKPYLPLPGRVWARWGILHKETWVEGGAPDDPEGFVFDPPVGSGPFQVKNFQLGSSLSLTPHDGHPKFSPEHDITFRGYSDIQSAFQAFQANELQVLPNLTPQLYQKVEEGMSDNATTLSTQGYLRIMLYPQFPKVPPKFKEFRQAIGMAINRQKINSVAYFNAQDDVPLDGTPLSETHPWHPGDSVMTQYTDKPQGDPDGAKKVLEDAGWGWDDNENLHYPTGANLTPLWPKGEEPPVEDFPCMEEMDND